jgi:hypothetical protein
VIGADNENKLPLGALLDGIQRDRQTILLGLDHPTAASPLSQLAKLYTNAYSPVAACVPAEGSLIVCSDVQHSLRRQLLKSRRTRVKLSFLHSIFRTRQFPDFISYERMKQMETQ